MPLNISYSKQIRGRLLHLLHHIMLRSLLVCAWCLETSLSRWSWPCEWLSQLTRRRCSFFSFLLLISSRVEVENGMVSQHVSSLGGCFKQIKLAVLSFSFERDKGERYFSGGHIQKNWGPQCLTNCNPIHRRSIKIFLKCAHQPRKPVPIRLLLAWTVLGNVFCMPVRGCAGYVCNFP